MEANFIFILVLVCKNRSSSKGVNPEAPATMFWIQEVVGIIEFKTDIVVDDGGNYFHRRVVIFSRQISARTGGEKGRTLRKRTVKRAESQVWKLTLPTGSISYIHSSKYRNALQIKFETNSAIDAVLYEAIGAPILLFADQLTGVDWIMWAICLGCSSVTHEFGGSWASILPSTDVGVLTSAWKSSRRCHQSSKGYNKYRWPAWQHYSHSRALLRLTAILN